MAVDLPYVGQPVVFLWLGGRDRIAGVITRIHGDGRVAITTFPYSGGSIFHDHVDRHVPGEELNAWVPLPSHLGNGDGR